MFENLTKEEIIYLLEKAGITKEKLEKEVLHTGVIQLWLEARKENTRESWTNYIAQLRYLLEAKDIAPSHKELLEMFIKKDINTAEYCDKTIVFKLAK